MRLTSKERVSAGAMVILAVCAALAACSGTPATTSPAPPGSSSSSSSSAQPTATPAAPVLSVAQLRQRAAADASSMLASFPPPPGGRRLAKPPAAVGSLLKHPAFSVGSFGMVDDVSWWQAPGQPEPLLGWEIAHIPAQFQLEGPNGGNPGDPNSAGYNTYWLPPVTGVLVFRDMVVEAVVSGSGQTAIRVDAQVTWQPPHPAAERVPSAARVVTIAEVSPGKKGSARLPAPVTRTSRALVNRLAAAVDGLALLPPGKYACPPPTGNAITLTFRAQPGGPVLAVANSGRGCDSVTFSIDGKGQPALSGASAFSSQVLTLAGLSWNLS